MTSFAPSSKRDASKGDDKLIENPFLDIPAIKYEPHAAPDNTLCFKYYNAKEVIHGRAMEDWLRFSVCAWHTFRGTGADPFGFPTLTRPWDDGSNSIENAKRRIRVAFQFFEKLGVKYWTFHDRDISPVGVTIEETRKNLDEITDLVLELQQQTGVKLLWATCNLFAEPKYMNGAMTNPDIRIYAQAAAQVKTGLDIANKLGAENYVFWGGREGYHTLLNTNIKTELDNMANFYRMVIAYKEKIGFTGQLLIEPKPKEPAKHQYDYDAMTSIGFLKHYQLDKYFKLNIEPNHTTLAGHSYEHDVVVASVFGMLGSIDANTGSPDLGWDTDQFPMDIKNATMMMKAVLDQGGIQPGGLNFDCKVRRESCDVKDMFIAHIGAMDTLARGLRNAVKIKKDGILDKHVQKRYQTFSEGLGKKVSDGLSSLEELQEFAITAGEPELTSGKQEHLEAIVNAYI